MSGIERTVRTRWSRDLIVTGVFILESWREMNLRSRRGIGRCGVTRATRPGLAGWTKQCTVEVESDIDLMNLI